MSNNSDIKITLMQASPIKIASHAIRTCYQSFAKSDDGGCADIELIEKVSKKFKHSSTIEHVYYTFYIEGISRATLQELARHRMASYSVKSSRYTLKELRKEDVIKEDDFELARKFIVLTGDENVDRASIKALENLRVILKDGVSNDIAKFCMPECYKTELTFSINARSMQNFITLRSDKRALWEIRNLAFALYDAVPEEHKFLYDLQES